MNSIDAKFDCYAKIACLRRILEDFGSSAEDSKDSLLYIETDGKLDCVATMEYSMLMIKITALSWSSTPC